MDKHTFTMVEDRPTKNTVRFSEETDSPQVIGTLYVQKWATGATPPHRIKVTIEEVE